MVQGELPETFSLGQNHTNQFNPATNITHGIPATTHTSLVVYDILGREVRAPVNQVMDAGTYEVSFHASNLPTGVYPYTLRAGS